MLNVLSLAAQTPAENHMTGSGLFWGIAAIVLLFFVFVWPLFKKK